MRNPKVVELCLSFILTILNYLLNLRKKRLKKITADLPVPQFVFQWVQSQSHILVSQSEVQISVSGSLMPSLLGLLAYFVGQTLSCVFKFCYLGQHFQQNMLLWSQGLASISSPTELCAERVPRWNWSVKSTSSSTGSRSWSTIQLCNCRFKVEWTFRNWRTHLYMLLVYEKLFLWVWLNMILS